MFVRAVNHHRLWAFAALVVMTIAACGSNPLQQAILGKWKFVESGAIVDGAFVPASLTTDCACSPLRNLEVEFNADGSLRQFGSGPSVSGQYTFVDANHIRLDIPEQQGAMASSTVYEIAITADRLHMRSSADEQTEEERYTKVP